MPYDGLLDKDEVPSASDPTEVDVRDLPPPEPLTETLETLSSLSDDEVLVQVNDREPQHLFPRLEERGYDHASVGEDPTYTAIWRD